MSIFRGVALVVGAVSGLIYVTIDRRRHSEFLFFGVMGMMMAARLA